MYEQIARNKRRMVIYIGVFFLFWLGIGAAVGELYALYSSSARPAGGSVAGDIVVGLALACTRSWLPWAFTTARPRLWSISWPNNPPCCPPLSMPGAS